MAGESRADEDLFAGSAEADAIRAEHARRTEEANASATDDELASRALNPRQRAFAEHYAKHGNGSKAYRDAGYESGNAEAVKACASRLLAQANVRAYIGELLDDLASPRIADAQERHEFLTAVMRGQVKRKSTFYGETITTHADVSESIKAAELLAKMNGELTEKREVKGDVVVRVVRSNKAPSAIGEQEGRDG
jgi:phage terminase small subunit